MSAPVVPYQTRIMLALDREGSQHVYTLDAGQQARAKRLPLSHRVWTSPRFSTGVS